MLSALVTNILEGKKRKIFQNCLLWGLFTTWTETKKYLYDMFAIKPTDKNQGIENMTKLVLSHFDDAFLYMEQDVKIISRENIWY